eukprot:208488-Pelagomonas_calceolata.AAC.2
MKENYVGRGNSPYINQGKGDTLARKSGESPPPQRCANCGHHRATKQKVLMGIRTAAGSSRLQNLAVRSTIVFNSTPQASSNKLVGIRNKMGMKFASKFNGTLVVKSQLLDPRFRLLGEGIQVWSYKHGPSRRMG